MVLKSDCFGEKKDNVIALPVLVDRYSMHQVLQHNTNDLPDEIRKAPSIVSTVGNDQLNTYFRHFAGYLTFSDNFRGYKRP